MVNNDILIKDWLTQQTNAQMLSWEQTVQKIYPQSLKLWTEAGEHFRSLMEDLNTFDAVKYLDWKMLLSGADIRVLDLGAGAGWLASFLSTFPNIKSIDALDSSKYILTVMLPEMVKLMNGNISKINPVVGLFCPLLVENEHYDIIVASCSIHHATNLFQILRECNRALRKKGKLLILNETPLTSAIYFLKVGLFFVSVMSCLIKRNFPECSPSLSRSGILYDPYLGDNIYSYSQWEQAIRQTGFSFKVIRTPYFFLKKKKYQIHKLTHFICEKV